MTRKAESETPAHEPFACVVLADRGGVGKTSVAALVWAALVELGREPVIGEVEGATERKMSALLEVAEAGPPRPNVVTPTPAELADNPRLNARTFAPVLAALLDPATPVIIDNGATVTRGLLDAAEAGRHGMRTDGGRHLRILVVAKAEDLQSAVSAEASLRRARAIYPNARIVLAVTHVRHDRQRGTHNAGPVVSAVEGGGKASSVVLIPLLTNPILGECYGERHIPFHLLAQMPVPDLSVLLGGADEEEAWIYAGQYLTWYNGVLAELAQALALPWPPSQPGTRVASPLEPVSAAA